MSTSIYLTDEQADLPSYLRAKIGSKSDAASLVQAVTQLVASGTNIQATRVASGAPVYGPTTLAWITDPLTGFTPGTATGWTFHVWGQEDDGADNAQFRFELYRFTNAEAGTAMLDTSGVGTELPTTSQDAAFTSSALVAPPTFASGDRLVIKVFFDNVGTMGSGKVTLSYNGLYAGAEGDSYVSAPDTITVLAALPSADITTIRNLLKDNGGTEQLADTEITQAFNDALRVYSQDRPRFDAQFYSGDGITFKYPLPRYWIRGFSEILEIEYPLNTTSTGGNNPYRQLLKRSDTDIIDYVSTTGIPQTVLWHLQYIPEAAANNMVVRYTTRHIHNSQVDTVNPDELEAVCWLAAAQCAVMLANKYASLSESSMVTGVDVANYRDLTARWMDMAKTWAQMYDDHIRGEEPAPHGVGEFVGWTSNLTFGLDRLFHRRRWESV